MEDDDECVEMPAGRFTRWDLFIAFFGMMMGICHAISQFWESLCVAAVMASNKQTQDDQFHEDAAMEIETLTEGSDG